uniref:Uncharacterized protein n=1 Tax=Aegilops tauschii subsp. strangulata TaxID=200361 RepID=A0A452Y8Y5_AEGTS
MPFCHVMTSVFILLASNMTNDCQLCRQLMRRSESFLTAILFIQELIFKRLAFP